MAGLPLEPECTMALTQTQRPTREWPLLVLTLGIVGLICFPLWQGLVGDSPASAGAAWDSQRWGRLLLGPEQIACYCCFTWTGFIILSRYLELRRQRAAFQLELLPTEQGSRILQEDARPLLRKLEQVTGQRPYILANMIRVALSKFSTSRSSQDISETVRTQAQVDQGRLVSSMATVHYLAWAIPAIGFLGTVRGLAGSMTMAGGGGEQLKVATRHLTVAFDCTLVALVLSLGAMFLIHMIQRDEEALVLDCQQFCLEHLVNRIYEPEALGDHGNGMIFAARDHALPPAAAGSHPERLPR
jgi:biopolymer transport protein ExbB/TolQ